MITGSEARTSLLRGFFLSNRAQNSRLCDKNFYESKCTMLDCQIDSLVYELYFSQNHYLYVLLILLTPK
jgi:hypothetical protein